MKRKLLLLLCSVLTSVSMWAWTSVTPENGKAYYLYNIGENSYWYGTKDEYGTTANIADATLVTVEYVSSNFKLAFVHGNTTYRIYQREGERDCDNTSGVEFWLDGSTSAYELRSKNPNSDNTRVMNSGGWFPKYNDGKRGNVTWQFIAKEEVENACATAAQLNNVMTSRGWERVTTLSQLQSNPEDYTFAIYSANVQDLMVQVKSDGRAKFVTATEALANDYNLFEIQNYTYGGNPYFVMKSKGTNGYFYPTAAWQLDAPSSKISADDNCRLTFEVSTNGVWRVKSLCNADDGSYWGLWTPSNGYKDGEELAGNKVEGIAASLLIYRLSKDITPISNLTNDGWTSGVANNSSSTEGTWDGTNYLTSYNQVWRWRSDPLDDGTYSQSYTAIKGGKYRISAWVRLYNENEGQETYSGATLFAGSNEVSVCEGGALYNDNKCYLGQYSVNINAAEDESFNFGFKLKGANFNWLSFKNVNVTYMGELLATAATGFNSGDNAAAGTWYRLVVPSNGSYLVTSSSSTTLKYTQDGTKCVSDDDYPQLSFASNASKVVNLSVGTFYFQSSDASTITVVKFASGLDVTGLIANPSFETGTRDGWDYNAGNVRVGGYEIWHVDNSYVKQSLSGLPMGIYRVSCQALHGEGESANSLLYAKSGEFEKTAEATEPTETTGGEAFEHETGRIQANHSLGRISVEVEVNSGSLEIGFKQTADAQWDVFSNFTLTYLGNASANLKVNDGKLGTFIAPFDITLPENVKAYSATSDEEKVTLTKIAEGGETLAAGTPVIIYGDGVSVNETFYGDATVSGNKTVGALTGILDNSNKTVPVNSYVLQTQDDTQAFYKLASAATGALNRCYVTAESGVTTARLAISIDEETAINAIEAAETEAGVLKDGKFLIGGKIVVVKNGVKYSVNGQKLN